MFVDNTFINELNMLVCKGTSIMSDGSFLFEKDFLNKKKHLEDRRYLDRLLVRRDLQIDSITETIKETRFTITFKTYDGNGIRYVRRNGTEYQFTQPDAIDLIEHGLESITAKYSLQESASQYVSLFSVIDVSTGGTAPKVIPSVGENVLVDRSQLAESPIIAIGTIGTSHEGEGRVVDNLAGAVLINSEAFSVADFCRASIVYEHPHESTYIANKVFILRFNRQISNSYRKQLYRFFLDNQNIIRQLQFNDAPNGSRYLISANTLKRLWVPKENALTESADWFEKLTELEKQRVDEKKRLFVIEEMMRVIVRTS